MIRIFTVDRLNASPAVFDREKLWWMNSQYLAQMDYATLRPHLEPFLAQVGLANADAARVEAAVSLHRVRARTLKELVEQIVPYFQDEVAYDPAASAKFLKDPALPELLEVLRDRYAALPGFGKDALEAALRALSDERGVKAGVLIHPTRMDLSGATGGPPLFDLIELMGRDRALGRLRRFLDFLRQGVPQPQG